MTLDFTAAAVADLQSIRSYTLETWGAGQECVFVDSLWNQFEEIMKNPQRWRFRNDLFPGCQLAAQGKHVMLFRVQGRILQIVRILHAAMDFPRHIPEDLRQ